MPFPYIVIPPIAIIPEEATDKFPTLAVPEILALLKNALPLTS